MIQIITIGLGAFLLFLLQPMITKIILPVFGGGSSIWLTALVFFQLLLLAGYGASHLIVKRWRPAYQVVGYIVLLALAVLFLPLQVRFIPLSDVPAAQIFILLAATLGLPYFILSMTSPMVQFWITAQTGTVSSNPYVLYGVSNLGSLAGLLAYPLLIETRLTNAQQAFFWSYGFVLYLVCLLASLLIYVKAAQPRERRTVPAEPLVPARARGNLSAAVRLGWVVQALVPSAALMVFTHHITVDVVSFPLLWVIPLCLYLLSFVICFFWPQVSRERPLRTLLVLLGMVCFSAALRGEFQITLLWRIIAACVCLFGLCLYFHGNLEREKPNTKDLTAFYLYLSMGGCLGGILVGIVAPLVFNSTLELYLVLIACVYLIFAPFLKKRSGAWLQGLRVIMALMVGLIFFNEEIARHADITFKARSFYGTYAIREFPAVAGKHVAARILSQGTTTHGGQARDTQGRLYPISYYHTKSGVGEAFRRLTGLEQIGAVGLGTGVVALYGQTGQQFDFYEIDPLVVDIARNRFDNLRASRASIRYYIGDARLQLRNQPDHRYDMLVLDAFTSGAIPTHLITLEAMREFLRVLKPNGVILYHISNQYVDLLPVLNCLADRLTLQIRHHYAYGDLARHTLRAHWVVLTRNRSALVRLTGHDPQWQAPDRHEICWRDDFSSLWSVVDIRP